MSKIPVSRAILEGQSQVVNGTGFLDPSELIDKTISSESQNTEAFAIHQQCIKGNFMKQEGVSNETLRLILSFINKNGISSIKILHDQALLNIGGQIVPYSLYKDLLIFNHCCKLLRAKSKEPFPPHLIEFMKGTCSF